MTTGGVTTTYGYDADGQLISLSLPGHTITYTYDAAGNRASVTDNGVMTAYTANNRNEYTTVGGTTYQYDADGNLISKTDASGTTTYTLNDENRLTGVNGPGLSAAYTYDALGLRSSETVNGQTTQDLLDPFGLGNVASEYDGSGHLLAHYVQGLGLVSRVDASGAAAYYDFDLTGNAVGLTNAAGAYVNHYSYLPFGQTTTLSAALPNPFTFVGQFGVMTDGSGTLNMRFRNYDTATAQFLSNDLLGLSGGFTNLRLYVGNAPLEGIDPSGLQRCSPARAKEIDKKYDAAQKAQVKNTFLPVNDYVGRGIGTGIGLLFGSLVGYLLGSIAASLFAPAFVVAGAFIIPVVGLGYAGYYFGGDPGAKQLSGFLGGLGLSHGDAPPASAGPGGGTCMPMPPPSATPTTPTKRGPTGKTPSLLAFDPNYLLGPAGSGLVQAVNPSQALSYTIGFENDPKIADLAAQVVTITEKLDPNLDWTTFQLGDLGFGSTTVHLAGGQAFHTTVNSINVDGTPLLVDIRGTLNLQTGVVTWTFLSLDPTTNQPPADVFAGFLPVDDATHRGEGLVTYTVRAKAGLVGGTALDAGASIVFDVNSPVPTNSFTNHVAVNPEVFVLGLDNQVYAQKLDANGSSASGYFLAAPGQVQTLTVGHDASGRPELFVLGLDNQVYALTLNGNGNPVGRYFLAAAGQVKSFTVGYDASNDPELFVLGLDSQVYAAHFNALGQPAAGYALTHAGQVKSFVVGHDASNDPEVFALGLDNQVYAQKLTAAGVSASGYGLTHAGQVKALSMGSDASGDPELFVLGLDNQVYTQAFTAAGSSVSGYVLTHVGTVKSLLVGHDAANNFEVFVLGQDNQVYAQHFSSTGTSTGGYILTSKGQVQDFQVAYDVFNDPELFVLGLDNQVYGEHFDSNGNPLGLYFFTKPGRVKALRTTA
jgi:RHS repeat-associated protein